MEDDEEEGGDGPAGAASLLLCLLLSSSFGTERIADMENARDGEGERECDRCGDGDRLLPAMPMPYP